MQYIGFLSKTQFNVSCWSPVGLEGQQLMDAGRVYFEDGTMLDTSKSMSFKNLDRPVSLLSVSFCGNLSAGTALRQL